MPRRHTIISGTGRAGTTFLVQLFTALGLDTGFRDIHADIYANCNAGMEWDIGDPKAPYIVKSPLLCDTLDAALAGGEIRVDHALVPMRDLFPAAESRRHVHARTDRKVFTGGIPGGLWHAEAPEQQEQALTLQLYKLILTLAERDIPVTLLSFPRLVRDSRYLYQKTRFLLGWTSFERFDEVFRQVARPDLVHDFRPGASPRG